MMAQFLEPSMLRAWLNSTSRLAIRLRLIRMNRMWNEKRGALFLHTTVIFIVYSKKMEGLFDFFDACILYSTKLHLPPLRFHCVGACWDQTQGSCDFGIGCQKLWPLIHTRLRLIHSRLHLINTRLNFIHNSATSHPHLLHPIQNSATSHPHSATSHPH
jgi:hypothetical protein